MLGGGRERGVWMGFFFVPKPTQANRGQSGVMPLKKKMKYDLLGGRESEILKRHESLLTVNYPMCSWKAFVRYTKLLAYTVDPIC